MQLFIPKIELDSLDKSELDIYQGLDAEPYGLDLATKVCKKLMQNPGEHTGLYFSHRDYCGLGLYYIDLQFMLGVVNDGYGPEPLLASCESDPDLVNWLSQESDQTMSLYGSHFNNQTITKSRLEWYLEENYSPTWNMYCLYMNDRRGQGRTR
ncbi:hypothetical protein [Sphingobacterium sp.]|uniref:hypothetical protein n=1 Tax=Sphingobacterium sp. TaxID=341027 RepID=UPI0028A81F02|nr:hypothetical protein [Sphingobacterium sp.]